MRNILLGGTWAKGNENTAVHSPYSGDLIADVSMADEDQLMEAIGTACTAAAEMKKLARFEIARGLRNITAALESRKEEFASCIIAESAKPARYARGEVDRAIATFAWAAGEAERFCGEAVPVDTQPSGAGKTAFTRRVPRGVIYGITPFNFPLNLVAHKVAPALASGNSIIIKPSDRTPLTSLLLGEVFLESGLPASALQVVPMKVEYMDRVYSDDRVNMISFTGSAPVGWSIKAKAAKKFVTLELGGNAAVIVDKTADVERSVSKCLVGAFAYSGQVCISVQRIFVHSELFDRWTDSFAEGAGKLNFGDPFDENTEISVMIDEAAAKRAEEWINEAVDHGAKKLTGGGRSGSSLEPTVLTNTTPEMKVVSEEAFAPVVVVERFSELENAVEMANHGKYGLQAGVFTQDLQSAITAADSLEYGGVIVNDVPTFRVDNMPYGGVKDSGFGREGVRYAMEEMTEPRLIVISG
ncbi:MAG: aldehyde dehydrogenase family protein [Acidobacteria bacterium]|nr:aldehyde dehydrogenase family protein [Acidobacteriota bacterium]